MKHGKIIEPAVGNVRDHERRTAKALASVGMTVEFVEPSDRDSTKSPDVLIDGVYWEVKSPRTDKMTQIEKNLKRASKQAPYIVIDSRRVKRISDTTLQKYLLGRLIAQKSIRRILFVNRRGEVVDIATLA
jgi:hypothetical protein